MEYPFFLIPFCRQYAEFVQEQVEAAKQKCADPIVLVEQRLDFSEYVPEGFGTGDCVIVGDGTLSVIDFKYGVGIVVEAEKNPQMMCYALGALALFDGIYDRRCSWIRRTEAEGGQGTDPLFLCPM